MSAGTFTAKSLIFTALIVGFFLFNGLSLLSRNKLSYVLIAAFALPPVLGSLAGAGQLLALVATGEIAARPSDTIASLVAALQVLVIAGLYINLLSRSTRAYVWQHHKE